MVTLMSERLNFDKGAPPLPLELAAKAVDASRRIKEPDQARKVFDDLAPALTRYRPDQKFCVSCAMLIEKQRQTDGMLDFWADLRRVFPSDTTALRMLMRWYRRERRADEGIAALHDIYPDSHVNLEQAENACLGFAELRAFHEIDQIMDSILPKHENARALRMRYIKILNQQSRYLEAKAVASTIQDAEKMGQSSRALIDTAFRRAAKMEQLYSHSAADVFAQIIDVIPTPKPFRAEALGPISFYTGQLGTGGAERQMTRIASAFQSHFQAGRTVGNMALTGPADVVVRHTTPESGADFFVPELRQARVETTSLANKRNVPLNQLCGVGGDIINLLELLPEDVFEATCKLIPHFQNRQTQVAYLWQDGGVLFASLAALIAGVPRIVTSFRGLPPNLRPNLYRPELSILYKTLARLPQVTFTANSQIAADAYEDWLDLTTGSVVVLPNAVLPIVKDGGSTEHRIWQEVMTQSLTCQTTVLGVFRFDENKRPLFWIDVAAAFLQAHPQTRFVVLGTGYLFAACRARIADLGLSDRIFLLGVQKNVGFFMHKADVLMHLARMEGLPNVLIEAQLAGLPVLATPAGGTAEVIDHKTTGYILNDAAHPKLSDVTNALSDLLNDPVKLGEMSESAQTYAAPRFLLDHILDRTANLFARPEKRTS